MNTQDRLNKYMKMREDTYKAFLEDPSLLSVCSKLIGDLESDIRKCRVELGINEWGYL